MNSPLSSILKARRVAAVALAVAVVPFAATTASAAPKAPSKGKRATWSQPASTPAPAATTSAATTSTPVSAVHAIGGYVFYNVTYLEAVELYFAAVAAAPAGYTPPPVYSVSATTTVSGTVEPGR
jgi:hypothetical protein